MALFNGMNPEFEDFTYISDSVRCHINFSKYGGRFRRAQEWMERTFVERMVPVMPRKTGNLVNRTIQKNASSYNDGWITTYGAPYGKKLYGGINPKSGDPWHWTNPDTQPYWGEYVIKQYKPELVAGVRDIIMGRK